MRPFSLLIKPASADCNLRCSYCFYLDRAGLYPGTSVHRMTDEVLERLVSSYMATAQPEYVFNWQGGEPTLMGLDFFRKVVELQVRHGEGSTVGNSLQTNGVLIDRAMARHLARYNFLVGLSLDGPPEVHDRFRVRMDGAGTHADVIRALGRLRRSRVEFNVLTLVSSANAGMGREVYRYLCGEGVDWHQYIPCVEFDESGSPLPWTIAGEQWGEFLCEVFDEWLDSGVGSVSVRLFDSVVALLAQGVVSSCHMSDNCCQYLVVEYNGDVYPCDFFVREDLRLGNMCSDSWESILSSEQYAAFGRGKSERNDVCGWCDYLRFCAADCLKHRIRPPGRSPRTLSWLCAGWKRFYEHSLPRFIGLAERLR